jgi:putative holliday junction resolvase
MKRDPSSRNASQKRLLAFDIGTKRIGLALWNPEARLASPLEVRERKDLKTDLAYFSHLVKQHRIEALVVGIPYNLEGKETPSTTNAKFWQETLAKHFEFPVYVTDEALSTKDAMSVLRQTGAKNKKQKVDSLAAALILEDFIRKAQESDDTIATVEEFNPPKA